MERQDTQPVFDSEAEFQQFLADNPEVSVSLFDTGFETSSIGEVTTEITSADDKEQQQQQIRMLHGRQQHTTDNNYAPELVVPSQSDIYYHNQGLMNNSAAGAPQQTVKQERPLNRNENQYPLHQERQMPLLNLNNGLGINQDERTVAGSLMQGIELSLIQSNGNDGNCNVRVQRQYEIVGAQHATHQPTVAMPDIPSTSAATTALPANFALPAPSPPPEEICQDIMGLMEAPQSNVVGRTVIKQEVKGAGEFVMPGLLNTNMEVPRAASIDFNTLSNWPGEYQMSLELPVPRDAHTKNNKYCYSKPLDRVYAFPYSAMEVRLKVVDWAFLGNASVRVCAVYKDPHHRMSSVSRCLNCMAKDKVSSKDKLEHIVQLNNSGASYGKIGERFTVTVPVKRPALGEDYFTLFTSFSCMTSCAGGPNRRLFDTVFSLMIDGVEKGRYILHTKCCKAPGRDMKKDEASLPTEQIAHVNSTVGTTAVSSGSPKRQSSQKAGSSGVNSGKRKKKTGGGHNVQSSDSEVERPSQLVAGIKKLKTSADDGSQTPPGCCKINVPIQFKEKVVEYIHCLIAKDHFTKNDPGFFSRLEH